MTYKHMPDFVAENISQQLFEKIKKNIGGG